MSETQIHGLMGSRPSRGSPGLDPGVASGAEVERDPGLQRSGLQDETPWTLGFRKGPSAEGDHPG